MTMTIGLGGRELEQMLDNADSFKRFRDDEIAALHAYLSTLPQQEPQETSTSQ